MKRILLTLAASAAAIAVVPAANAAVLMPDQTGVTFDPFDVGTQGVFLDGATLTGDAATFDAIMRTAVYRNTAGTLDFYYQVALTQLDAGEEVARLTAARFAGYTVNALVATGDIDGDGSTGPSGTVNFTAAMNPNSDGPGGTSVGFTSTAERSSGTGATVAARFGRNGLEGAGETSATYIFRTNATSFNTSGLFASIDGSSVTVNAFQPVGPGVPEPATWAMMMLGFGAMGAMLRRRQRTTARIRFA